MAVVFRNGFFSLSLSLPSLMHPLPPLSLSLPHPPAWNSVRAEAGCRIEGLSIFSGRIHSGVPVLPTRDPRVRSFLDPPSFFPSPRPFFLFSRSAFYAPRKSGERAPVSLPPSPSSLPLFFFFLPSTPLRFHSVFPSAWRDSRLTYNKHTHSGGGEGGGSLVGCQPQKRNKTALLAASTVENRDQERERERE